MDQQPFKYNNCSKISYNHCKKNEPPHQGDLCYVQCPIQKPPVWICRFWIGDVIIRITPSQTAAKEIAIRTYKYSITKTKLREQIENFKFGCVND